MAYSRKELITQINEERKKAKTILYNKTGISKLKKDELNKIMNDLKILNNAYKTENEEDEKKAILQDTNDLEGKKKQILNELEILKKEEKEAEIYIEELEFNDEDEANDEARVEEEYNKTHTIEKSDNYDDFLNYDNANLEYERLEEDDIEDNNNNNKYNMNITQKIERDEKPKQMTREELKSRTLEEKVFDDDEDDDDSDDYNEKKYGSYKLSLPQAEQQILETLLNFKLIMNDKIKEVKRFKRMNLLTQKFIDEVINEHNFYREEAEEQIGGIMDNLRDDLDFKKSFVSKINRAFNSILEKTEKAVS